MWKILFSIIEIIFTLYLLIFTKHFIKSCHDFQKKVFHIDVGEDTVIEKWIVRIGVILGLVLKILKQIKK